MKNTEAVRAAFSQMQRQAENLGAGYKIEPRVSSTGSTTGCTTTLITFF